MYSLEFLMPIDAKKSLSNRAPFYILTFVLAPRGVQKLKTKSRAHNTNRISTLGSLPKKEDPKANDYFFVFCSWDSYWNESPEYKCRPYKIMEEIEPLMISKTDKCTCALMLKRIFPNKKSKKSKKSKSKFVFTSCTKLQLLMCNVILDIKQLGGTLRNN